MILRIELNRRLLNIVGLSIFIAHFLSACSPEDGDFEFLNPTSQNLQERNIVEKLVLKDSLNLNEEFEITTAGALAKNPEYLFVRDHPSLRKIIAIGKKSLEIESVLEVPEGRGPGELGSIGRFDAASGGVVLPSEELLKIQLWSISGDLMDEFILEKIRPHRVNLMNDGTVMVLSPSLIDGYLFHQIDHSGILSDSFGSVKVDESESFNPIMYSGSITSDGEFLYYAGFSEHVLAKWDLDGNLHYSVTSIDEFPSDLNYITFEDGGQRGVRYSEHGYFSALSIEAYKDWLLIVHAGTSGDEPYRQFLDVYRKLDGQYIKSYELPYRSGTGDLLASDNYLYTLHRINGVDYLGIYENPLTE